MVGPIDVATLVALLGWEDDLVQNQVGQKEIANTSANTNKDRE